MDIILSENHLLNIGKMTVTFTSLEFAVQSIVWALIGDQPRLGVVITSELSFPRLRSVAIGLYLERFGEIQISIH